MPPTLATRLHGLLCPSGTPFPQGAKALLALYLPRFGVILGFYSFFSPVILRREWEQEEAPLEERGCWGETAIRP